MEVKAKKVLESLEQLKGILKPMEGMGKNRCWWDMEECSYYSEIKGFQDAGARCAICGRLIDRERLFSIFKIIAPDFVDEALDEVCAQIEKELTTLIEELKQRRKR